MVNAEQVVIDIVARDNASSILSKIASDLQALKNVGGNIGGNLNIPTVPITNDVNHIKEQIGVAQKALNGLNSSTTTSTPPSSIENVNKALERLRQNAQKNIRINIDKGNVSSTTEQVHQLEMMVNKVRANSQQSFAGSGGGFQLVGSPYTPYSPNFNMVGMPYNPTKLLGSGEGNYGNNSLVKNPEISRIYDHFNNASKGAKDFAKASQDAGKLSYSSFHQLNNMMVVVGGTISDMGSKIAGVFGAAGLGGMIQKMWEGASQRQQNMMYLMHQKGTEQANKYYDEIMDIVTKLPGDDTFLTNILNMASALDSSLKLDNLKEAGTAITDYYMAATMKGENSYETQKDIRKYITTGDTRGMRNSVLASEIDSLKEKNSVLERTQALEKALEKTGFKGMSEYESATNELEEFKGHFQKAFADLGMIIIAIVQPLMNLYNTLDTVFGSRISQLIIIMATALVTLFSVIGGGLIIVSSSFRMIETITLSMEALSFALDANITRHGLFNTLLIMSIGEEKAKAIATDGNVAATMRDTIATAKNNIARAMGIGVTEGQTVSTWQLIFATLSLIKSKVLLTASTIKFVYSVIDDIIWTWRNTDAKLSEVIATKLDSLAVQSNTIAKMRNTLSKIKDIAITIGLVGITIVQTFYTMLSTGASIEEASAHAIDAVMKTADAEATFGLATATALLEATLAPLIVPLLLIVGAIVAIIVAIEKLGEAFGWWSDFGSMIDAISQGITRLWNAFMGSEVVQGIIQYFGDFIATIQDVFKSISDLYAKLFGWDSSDNGTFDLVQSIINIFGRLGEIIKWVWNLMDDWSNSPLGIASWISPIGILIFHLDELGSWFEDVRDAIDIFAESTEFNELISAFNDLWSSLQEPFQEIWNLVNEIMGLFGEVFQDPEGQGTEERINFLVELFKGLATIIRVLVIPTMKGLVFVINMVLLPIRVILTIIKATVSAIQIAIQWLGMFHTAWEVLMSPITLVQKTIEILTNTVKSVSDAIKNSVIGKLLGWDKDNNTDDTVKRKTLHQTELGILKTNLHPERKEELINKLREQEGLTTNNVNNVSNLGRTYNNHNNQRQVIINQNFSEGSIPVDARNMTRKEARKMFIGAFGYNRSVGSRGILR